MGNLAGKRLLLLGGSQWKDSIKCYADSEGITLLAAGNNSSSAYFEIASEKFGIDSTDVVAMKKLIIRERVDGVYLGGTEPVIEAAAGYLPDVALPTYCTQEQFKTFSDKAEFKRLCAEHELPVLPRLSKKEASAIVSAERPIVTKPVDGSGSRGFSVCRNERELAAGILKAEKSSFTGAALIEEFVSNDSVVAFYTICNGMVIYSGLEDKYPVRHEGQSSYVAGMLVFESADARRFRSLYENKIIAMFKDAGLLQGTLWMEAFRSGDGFVFNEAGYRYGGSMSMYPISFFHGINQVAMDIHYALTGVGDMAAGCPLVSHNTIKWKRYCVYPVHVCSGRVAAIAGVDELLANEHVVAVPFSKNVGDCVEPTGTIGQVFAYVHFAFDDIQECRAIIDRIHNTLHVEDEDGREMVLRLFDFEERGIAL